jgi:hypothetical protein
VVSATKWSFKLRKGTASQAAEKLVVLKGHDFSRAVSAAKSMRSLATEGRFSAILPESRPFSRNLFSRAANSPKEPRL